MKKCKVEWANVWTTKGKFFVGDELELTTAEVDELKAAGAVSVKRGPKKAETEE